MTIKKSAEAARSLEQLLSAYDLTPSEMRTTRYLCDGYSVAQIATTLVLSKHTIRTHLKRSLSKTDTHSQAELIELVRGLAAK